MNRVQKNEFAECVILREGISKILSKSNKKMNLSTIIQKKSPSLILRATAQLIEVIDTVEKNHQIVTDLFLSNNLIKDLNKVPQFYNLTRLMIEFNQISRTYHLKPLKKLSRLNEIKLVGNPICNYPLYESYLILWCKRLTSLNGKPVNREIEKEAYFDIEISTNVYYSTLILQIIRLKNMKIDQDKINEKIVQFLNQSKYESFRDQFESKCPKDIDQYFQYLKNIVNQVQKQISTAISDQQNEDFAIDHVDNIHLFEDASDMESLLEISQKQIVIDLNLIGIQSNKQYTNTLLKAAKGRKIATKLITDFMRIAKQYQRISHFKKRTKTIVRSTKKLFQRRTNKNDFNFKLMKHNIRMQKHLDPIIRRKLEKDLNKKIIHAIKTRKVKVKFNPKSLLSRAIKSKKIPNDIKMQRLRKRLQIIEEYKNCERLGLSFEHQLKQEILSQKRPSESLPSLNNYDDLLGLGAPRRRTDLKATVKKKRRSQSIIQEKSEFELNTDSEQIEQLASDVLKEFTQFTQKLDEVSGVQPTMQELLENPAPRRSERARSFISPKHNSMEAKPRCPLPPVPSINVHDTPRNLVDQAMTPSPINSDKFVNDFLNSKPDGSRRKKRNSGIYLRVETSSLL